MWNITICDLRYSYTQVCVIQSQMAAVQDEQQNPPSKKSGPNLCASQYFGV